MLTEWQRRERLEAERSRRYNEGRIVSVDPYEDGDGWSIEWEDERYGGKWGCGFQRVEGAPEPQVGDRVRLYGRFGSPIEGGDLNGIPVWYQTKAERNAEHEAWRTKYHFEKREDFERARAKLDADYDSLPVLFRDRIDKFRRTREDWRWEYESYEMSCCLDAVKIASAAREAAQLTRSPIGDWFKAFEKMAWDNQLAAVPNLYDGHSGNSFSFALRLAWLSVTDPKMVVYEHGAMVPLTGCEDYGCPHPLPADLLVRYPVGQEVASRPGEGR